MRHRIWQRIQQWRCGAIDTESADMKQKGETGRKQIFSTAMTEAAEMWEDKIRHNAWENINSVPVGGTATEDLMDLSLSHAKLRPTKKRPT